MPKYISQHVYLLTKRQQTTRMYDFYSIHEFIVVGKMKTKTFDDAKYVYNRYVHIVKLRFKEEQAEERRFFIDEADRWLQIQQDKENERLWELHYKYDYLEDDSYDPEAKYGLDN